MSSNTCAACLKALPKKEFLACTLCKLKYDIDCVNISCKVFNSMDSFKKGSWNCPACQSKRPKNGNMNTPVRPCADSPPREYSSSPSTPADSINVTQRYKAPRFLPDSLETSEYVTETRFREILKQELSAALKANKAQVTTELKNFREEFVSFRESLSFFSQKFDCMQTSLEEKSVVIEQLKSENKDLKEAMKEMSTKLNTVDLHMRESNIEINGIPEHRSENLFDTVVLISKAIDHPLTVDDIQNVTRIAKLDRDNDRPRGIIAKLRSPRHRDGILAAVSQFNKKNPNEKLSSHHMGIGGTRRPVFVSEHLTPANKSLHAAARKKGKEFSYKFVWTRNGRIYVRKDEFSQALIIKNLEGLDQIK